MLVYSSKFSPCIYTQAQHFAYLVLMQFFKTDNRGTCEMSATAASGGGLEYGSRSKRLAFGGVAYRLNLGIPRLDVAGHLSGFPIRSA